MYKRMFRPACPMETYYQIARQLKMPLGTVSQLQFMPTFLFRTQKPLSLISKKIFTTTNTSA
jgi:hypothetical protein